MSEDLKARKEKLFSAEKNGYANLSAAREAEMEDYCGKYMDFLRRGVTERLAAQRAVELAQERGFKEYRRGMALHAGDKV